ncbi:hypothetical protein MKW94_026224 [Papaver nudicaule]|uniref:Peptidase A1 domain-containing protein n=1 Tax=Papaver nudicaule TaxID=74823 RepID=A0AA41V6M1_PAPNU|nr:hypothetical protein [Papaver nudicaule]
MATTHFSLVFILLVSVLVHGNANGNGGFSVQLIHRDFSPKSPYYDPLETHHDRVHKAIHRSINRNNGAFKKSSVASFPANANRNGNITTTLTASSYGEYLMNISVGTPPRQLLAVADTGSDLTWIQCKPCEDCYEQNEPIFDPKGSSSYKSIHCLTPVCFKLSARSCENKLCGYDVGYGDNSSSTGHLAFETLTFDSTSGRPVKIPQFAIGCGHSNLGFMDAHSSGLVGLGTGKLSLISQLAARIDSKFSYCLAHSAAGSSKFNFGGHPETTGKDVYSTPFMTADDGAYYLTLEAVSVDDKRIPFKSMPTSTKEPEGNVAIDSGSTLTHLPEEMYSEILSEVKKAKKSEGFMSPTFPGMLCYKDDDNTRYPSITFHFTGADIKLPEENSFVGTQDGVCLNCLPAFDDIVVYGNVAQNNFLVEYDLKDSKVSFKPTDCSKHN